MSTTKTATPTSEHIGPLRIPPVVSSVNEGFWRGGEHGELRIVRCHACGLYNHPPRERCRACHSADVAADAVSGRGTIVTYTVNHQQWNPAGHVEPYVIALVALDEEPQVQLMTNVVGCTPDEVTIGAAVSVVFEQLDDVWLPLFELVR
jgi:uncharacterized OB-fold protein